MTILPHLHNPPGDNIGTVKAESAAQRRTGFPPELRYTRALRAQVPLACQPVSAALSQ